METTEPKNQSRFYHDRPGRRGGWIALGIIGFITFVFLFGAVLMWLWNWLMPAIFHLGIITYWQAVGLAILGRLLFGGMHHGGRYYKGHRRFPSRDYRNHFRDARYWCYPRSEKWSYYEQYWNEEGEQAFEDYIKRNKESGSAPE
jgi:hypothetical protein